MKSAVALVALAGFVFAAQDSAVLKVGQICPAFVLKTVDGSKEIKIEDFRKKEGSEGQFVVLTFWSFKCPSGEKALPDLAKVYELCKEKKVEFIGICSYGESAEDLAKYATDNKIDYTLLYDAETKVAKSLDPKVVTCSYILDREGRCLYKGAYKGRKNQAGLMDALKEVLDGKEVTVKESAAKG
ncbi:MAG TPA: redoxin domain-containing protein [Planctomycetota bacterium]|nr:redoxin domain-containing protein [Planctomycetota bacterium]